MRLSYFLSGTILATWVAVAYAAGLGFTATQGSRLLLKYGACNAYLIEHHQWWRLLTSQWLHSKFLHMIFNASVVAFAGAALERRLIWWLVLPLYLLGGALAIFISVQTYPSEVSSGASQAMLVLCGAAILGLWSRPFPLNVLASLIVIVAVQVTLDLQAIGGLKVGHLAGLSIGLLAGAAIRFQSARVHARVS